MAGNQAELVALIQRLELVTSRLEKVPGAGGAAAASSNKDAGTFGFELNFFSWKRGIDDETTFPDLTPLQLYHDLDI